jgi:hypothetical protein
MMIRISTSINKHTLFTLKAYARKFWECLEEWKCKIESRLKKMEYVVDDLMTSDSDLWLPSVNYPDWNLELTKPTTNFETKVQIKLNSRKPLLQQCGMKAK